MTRTSRTIGPLHFEDLEPKRFEDLIRQLAYDFRVWRRLEATGRAGCDGGFDARGLEIVPDGDTPELEDDGGDADQRLTSTASDRLWLIQCKREKSIGPKQLAAYLKDIQLQQGETLHGIIFAAACDFSKKAHDTFTTACRSLGIQECYLWGKAALEDMLFQPKNDHLLFAYFGFSLSIRQRNLQSTLRRDIATKKRLNGVVERLREHTGHEILIIRNAFGDIYPNNPKRAARFDATHWRICPFEELSHKGLVIEFAAYLAFTDGEAWDAADQDRLHRSHLHLSRMWQGREDDADYDGVNTLWQGFPQANRAWLRVLGVIPYDRILGIDDIGDDYFALPHVYCRYEGRFPFTDTYGRLEPIAGMDKRWVTVDDKHRVVKFPPQFRRPS
jgi:hypothetical protein